MNKKIVCLPYLNFSDPLPETHLFFIWPNRDVQCMDSLKSQITMLCHSKSLLIQQVCSVKFSPVHTLLFIFAGYEHNIGVFVSLVEAGSQAEQHGLKVHFIIYYICFVCLF